MPDYKRIVSYIYNYEDGKKKNNVGYARVEARNGQCKCTLHISAPSLNDRQLQVYFFKRKGGVEGILLGTMGVKGGNGDFKTITDPMHLMNSPYGLEDMSGILLYLTDRKFFATSWDEATITTELVSDITGSKTEPKLRAAGIENENKESTRKTEETPKEAKDNIIKIHFNDNGKNSNQTELEKKEEILEQKEPQHDPITHEQKESQSIEKVQKPDEVENIMEADEYRDQNEGEVYNDWHEDREEDLKLSSQDTGKALPMEADKEDTKAETKVSDQKGNNTYIEIPEELKQELNERVELLQKEDLSESKSSPSKEEESKTIGEKAEENIAGTDSDAEAEVVTSPENGQKESEPQDQKAEIHFNNSELKPESISPQVEENGKCCMDEPGKQPFYEDHPIAKKLYLGYPRMYPFEDNDVVWCVRIEPQDIGLFPMESWILANNSFLLHGYYSYRHLIFARVNDKNGVTYILGVPGIYHNREKFMARMFGFENFKCAKRKVQRTGEFGYWYIPITIN